MDAQPFRENVDIFDSIEVFYNWPRRHSLPDSEAFEEYWREQG
jgi:hypothetical protein